jgi:hypothetical protein
LDGIKGFIASNGNAKKGFAFLVLVVVIVDPRRVRTLCILRERASLHPRRRSCSETSIRGELALNAVELLWSASIWQDLMLRYDVSGIPDRNF